MTFKWKRIKSENKTYASQNLASIFIFNFNFLTCISQEENERNITLYFPKIESFMLISN